MYQLRNLTIVPHSSSPNTCTHHTLSQLQPQLRSHTVRGFIQVRYCTIQAGTQPNESGTGKKQTTAAGVGLAQPVSTALISHPMHHTCSHEATVSGLLSHSKACTRRRWVKPQELRHGYRVCSSLVQQTTATASVPMAHVHALKTGSHHKHRPAWLP